MGVEIVPRSAVELLREWMGGGSWDMEIAFRTKIAPKRLPIIHLRIESVRCSSIRSILRVEKLLLRKWFQMADG
jgi:hypothetical protein